MDGLWVAPAIAFVLVARWGTGTTHSVARLHRARMHTSGLDFPNSIVLALATMAGSAYGSYRISRSAAPPPVDLVIAPLIWGAVALVLSLVVIHGGEFMYRYTRQTQKGGRDRTLYGLNTSDVEAAIRRSPISVGVWMCIDESEVRGFTAEILCLLGRATMSSPGSPGFDGRDIRDVLISMPVSGNEGLEALDEFLLRHGYRSAIERWDSAHAHIHIGAAQ